ncbi:serine hydrolase domain-containing protein [Acidicapsa acidisoli]|uniref:serine hydrolase domain-containing protein n=1 Tax=Acidicapsa acidisoli TaxID=1615681 RepID=UPI0021E044DA|nr:serine hydrolase domain-containing protein [Acidicapsa acidisoli]
MNIPTLHKSPSTIIALSVAILLAGACLHAQEKGQKPAAVDLTVTTPETVGFSSERLERLHALMQEAVDKKLQAGIVTILARHGKVVDYRTYGERDMAGHTPITKDTIFRDYSMTKPVTGVAMMILYEQGKWLPSDPISKFIPEFKDLKVFKGMNGDGKMILADPDHAPTMRELMTHTAGFTYGFFGDTPIDALYRDQKVLQSANLHEMIEKLAKIPLVYQPGTQWRYSVSMDIQGYIVEKLSGQSLPDFMREHIYEPLGMKDAGFFVPEEKRSRFMTLYRSAANGELEADSNAGPNPRDYDHLPTLPSGGGGMVSTAEDYYRFASMLAGGGELNGTRVLAPATVKLMSSNHLPPSLLTGEFGIGAQTMRPGFGYGYNCAVVFNPGDANLPDGKGTFFWDGAAGTWFWIDPTNDIVFVGMIQRMGGNGGMNLQYLSRAVVYGALVDPAK